MKFPELFDVSISSLNPILILMVYEPIFVGVHFSGIVMLTESKGSSSVYSPIYSSTVSLV